MKQSTEPMAKINQNTNFRAVLAIILTQYPSIASSRDMHFTAQTNSVVLIAASKSCVSHSGCH
jgi:hypothetical protein